MRGRNTKRNLSRRLPGGGHRLAGSHQLQQHLQQTLPGLGSQPLQESVYFIETQLLQFRRRRSRSEPAGISFISDTEKQEEKSHQSVSHLAEPVGLVETKAVVLKLSPDKQAGFESERWGLQPQTLERPGHR